MMKHGTIIFTAVALLSACSGRVVPAGKPASASNIPPVAGPAAAQSAPASGGAIVTSTTGTAAPPIPATPAAALPPPAVAGDGKNAASLGLVRGPLISSLSLGKAKTDIAMATFRTSCPGLLKRDDGSGLTQNADWQAACDAVKSWTGDGQSFFATFMEAVQVGDGKAHATGYYEPQILGSRTQQKGYDVAIYKRPADLIDVDLGQFSDELKGKSIRGKVNGSKFIPYDERASIVDGALAGKGLELAWAADPVEFFFLQIQGSGRVLLPDGSIMRIGYESQNGRAYTGIGKLMKDRGLIQKGSMQDIANYLNAHPAEGAAIMNENKSFVFFKELSGNAPNGAMGYAVVAESTVAADPKYIPLGAPVWLSMDRAEPNGLWIAQDTGGAIKGANRVDTFWGFGDRAVGIAGGMSARGAALLFLPKASVARLLAPPPPSVTPAPGP